MRRSKKIWIIVAILLVIIGSLIFTGALAALDFDFSKLSTQKYETNAYEINEDFDKILINVETTDITFLPADNGKCKVVCFEEEKIKHSAVVQDGMLVIKTVDTRKWYAHIDISFKSMNITVYLPKNEYASLSINTDTGDIKMPNDFTFNSISVESDTGDIDWEASVSDILKIDTDTGYINTKSISANEIDVCATTGNISIDSSNFKEAVKIETDTGKIQLNDVNCKNITAKSDTGNISLKNSVAAESFSIENDTGNVQFEYSDAASIFVKTDTGDVNGTLLSEKVFITKSSTGSIDVPKTITGGKCEITTYTGDIRIDIQ